MIVAIVGKPGAGKSYSGCVRILDAVRSGREVVTDMPLVREKWADFDTLEIKTPASFKRVDEWRCVTNEEKVITRDDQPIGPLVVVDEAGQVFAGLGLSETQAVLGILAEHRHSYADVVLLVQHHSRLPVEVKNLVDEWVECTSYRKAGIQGFSWASYARWYGVRSAISSGMSRYKRDVFSLYDSHALGAGAGGTKGEVVTASTVVRFWLRWPVLMVGFSAAALVWLLATGWDRIARALGGEFRTGSELSLDGGSPPAGMMQDVAGTVAASLSPGTSSSKPAHAEAPAAAISRWVGVVGDGVLIERADGRQDMLSVARLAQEGWTVGGRAGDFYLVHVTGVRVYQ